MKEYSKFYNHVPDICLFAGITFAAVLGKAAPWYTFNSIFALLFGVGVFIGAVVLMVFTMHYLRKIASSTNPLDPPKILIDGGPFSFSRNPLYLAYICAVLGAALISGSYVAFILPVICWAVISIFVIPKEEYS